MSHVTHGNAACHTCMSNVTSHVAIRRVTYMDKSWHVTHGTSCHICGWVTSHIAMWDITHVDGSGQYVISHMWMSHVKHGHASHHKRMSQVTHHSWQSVMSRMWTSHVTHGIYRITRVDESCIYNRERDTTQYMYNRERDTQDKESLTLAFSSVCPPFNKYIYIERERDARQRVSLCRVFVSVSGIPFIYIYI